MPAFLLRRQPKDLAGVGGDQVDGAIGTDHWLIGAAIGPEGDLLPTSVGDLASPAHFSAFGTYTQTFTLTVTE